MSMMKCPYCGKEVSDKSKVCPGCKQKLISETTYVTCKECGLEYSKDIGACPKCGCTEHRKKDEGFGRKKKRNGKKVLILILSAVLLITAALGIGAFVKNKNAKREVSEHFESMRVTTLTMMTGVSKGEEAGELIISVWHNTLHKEKSTVTDKFTQNGTSGFNEDPTDSLATLFADADFENDLSDIENNIESVESLMKTLENPPKEHETVYESVKKLNEAYTEFLSIVLSPEGDLETYSADFEALKSEIDTLYKETQTHFS